MYAASPGDVCYSDAHCRLWGSDTHCDFLIPNLFGRCQCNPPMKQRGNSCIQTNFPSAEADVSASGPSAMDTPNTSFSSSAWASSSSDTDTWVPVSSTTIPSPTTITTTTQAPTTTRAVTSTSTSTFAQILSNDIPPIKSTEAPKPQEHRHTTIPPTAPTPPAMTTLAPSPSAAAAIAFSPLSLVLSDSGEPSATETELQDETTVYETQEITTEAQQQFTEAATTEGHSFIPLFSQFSEETSHLPQRDATPGPVTTEETTLREESSSVSTPLGETTTPVIQPSATGE
ncbi:hypothetical protein C0J52_07466 [Blattella germanica]|nr:hypothetical protein C0J52_07466 [Blattella germanica]